MKSEISFIAFCLTAAWLAVPVPSFAGLMNGAPVVVSGETFGAQNGNMDWSLDAAGTSACMHRFEVRSGDHWYGDVLLQKGLQERSELTEHPVQSTIDGFNIDLWTAYQFMIEPGPANTSHWVVLGDWHVQLDPGDAPASSPWQIELLPGDFLTFYTATSPQKPIPAMMGQFPWKSSAPIARGVWHSIVSKVDFDWHPGGHGVQLWFDGAHVVDYKGPVGFNTSKPNYFKFGIYRLQTIEPLAVRFANVDISRSSLARRIGHPPQICAAARQEERRKDGERP